MRNLKWTDTSEIVIRLKNEKGAAILGLRADNFISRRTRESKRMRNFCSPLNVLLLVWFLLLALALLYLYLDEY